MKRIMKRKRRKRKILGRRVKNRWTLGRGEKKNQISTKGAEERQVSAPGPQTVVVAVSVLCGSFVYRSVCLLGSNDHPFLGRCSKRG